MTREERRLGKQLKALISSGQSGHVTVHVADGRILSVEQGTDPAVPREPGGTAYISGVADPIPPIERPSVSPLTTREDEESRG